MADEKSIRHPRAKETAPRKQKVKVAFHLDRIEGESDQEYRRRYGRAYYHFRKASDPEFAKLQVQKSAAYRKRYPERSKVQRQEEYQKARDVIIKRVADWFRDNPDRAAQSKREYYLTHKEEHRANWNRWKAENRDRLYAIQHAQRVKGREAAGRFTAEDINEIFSAQGGKCALCKASLKRAKKHLDHIMPLSKGGTNHRKNLQWLCALCNHRKAAKDPADFARELGLLI